MADLQTLLDQALYPTSPAAAFEGQGSFLPTVPAAPLVPQKQAAVVQASDAKKIALGGQPAPAVDYAQVAAGMGNQKGANSMSPVEQDLRTLNRTQLSLKYGSERAHQMIAELAAAESQRFQDATTGRSAGATTGDLALGVASGLEGSLGGIASWGTGLVNDNAGAWLAGKTQDGQDWLNGNVSSAVAGARRNRDASAGLEFRDNAVKREQELASGSSETMADLRRWGRDVVASVKNSGDPTLLAQGTAEGVGSLLAGGPVAKGVRLAGMAALGGEAAVNAAQATKALQAAVGVETTGAVATTVARKQLLDAAAWPATTALLEGGGAYQGTVQEVMGKTHEQLMTGSPDYKQLVESGMDPEQAKIQVATQAGRTAAMIQAPIGAATGLLTRFEEKPFHVPSVKSAAADVLVKEPTEEAIQGATGQMAQNYAIQQNADSSRSLSEGVGDQTAQGAIFGMGAAGVVQAPGAAKHAAVNTVKAAASGVGSLFAKLEQRGELAQQNTEQASPVADATVVAKNEAVVASAPQDTEVMNQAVDTSTAAPEVKAQNKEAIATLVQAAHFNPAEEEHVKTAPPEVQQLLEGVSNRAEAVQRLARLVHSSEGGYQIGAAALLLKVREPLERAKQLHADVLDSLPENDPARLTMLGYMQLAQQIDQAPSVKNAMNTAEELIKKMMPEATPLAAEEIGTQQGQEKVDAAVVAATIAPTEINPELAQSILKHADEQRLNLTPDQRASLQVSIDLVRARQTLEKTIADKGLRNAKDVVSSEIIGNTGNGTKGESAAQHAKNVVSAMRAGNVQDAQFYLNDFAKFVQHMTNKVNALNKHVQGGDPHAKGLFFKALHPTSREWVKSKKPVFVNTKQANSVDLAQSAEVEQNILADVYNGLAKAFPELQGRPLPKVSLDTRLQGKPQEVVDRMHPTRQAAAETTQPSVEQKTEVTPVKPKLDTPDDIVGKAFEEELRNDPKQQRLNLSEEQIQGLAENRKADRDGTTGWTDARQEREIFDDKGNVTSTERMPVAVHTLKQLALQSAVKYLLEDPSLLVSYVSIDLANLGGINAFFNNVQNDANAAFRDIANIIRDEIKQLDPQATFMRTGGDELGIIVKDAQPGEIQAAMVEARRRVKEYADKNGFGQITHAKDKIKNFGVDIYSGVQKIDPYDSTETFGGKYPSNETLMNNQKYLADVANRNEAMADAQLDLQKIQFKEELLNVNRSADEANGDGTSDRATGLSDQTSTGKEDQGAPATSQEEPSRRESQPVEAVKQPEQYVSRVTPEQATRLSDEGLNDRINALQDKMFAKTATPADIATFAVLNNEMSDRETAAQEKADAEAKAAPTPVVQEPVVEQKKETGIRAIYNNLMDHVDNMFVKYFKEPGGEKAPTRLIGEENPIALVTDALSSSVSLDEVLGEEAKNTLTPVIMKGYQQLLSMDKNGQSVGGIMAKMRQNLASFLNEEYTKGKTARQVFLEGNPLNRITRGKVLNIVSPVGESFDYQPELLEAAALAAVQWLITAGNNEVQLDEEDAADIAGVESENLSQEELANILVGQSLPQLKFALAKKIRAYWGVKADRNTPMAYADGIPEAMAAEVIRAMGNLGMIGRTRTVLGVEHGLAAPKTIDRYTFNPEVVPEAVQAFPDAIDQVVLSEPEESSYLDGEVPPVAKMQMNNPDVQNTQQQMLALKNEQKTPHFLHMPMVNLFMAIGEKGLRNIFGEGETEGGVFNENHQTAIESKNRTVTAAFHELMNKFAEIENRADTKGVSPDTMEIRYAYNMTRTGRMQMLGRHNPQASKLVREAILPTWSTLDLSSNAAHKEAFALATAQALGIKVHKQSPAESMAEVQALLSGPLAPALKLMADWVLRNDLSTSPNKTLPSDFPIEELSAVFQAAEKDLSFAALNALLENARLSQAKDQSQFRTPLYLEADGVTNGPINAMMLMSIGKFTADFVRNVAKGGIAFGKKQAMHTLDKVDLYETSTLNTSTFLQGMFNEIRKQKGGAAIQNQVNALHRLMALVLPKEISFDDKGNLKLKRGIAKNPLTITIYGSSERGIANKLTGIITDQLYVNMSAAAQRMKADPSLSLAQAYFPGDTNADVRFEELMGLLEQLTNVELKNHPEYGYSVKSAATEALVRNPLTFTLGKEHLKVLQQNMLEGFVTSMTKGINETVGKGLTKAVGQIKQATQIQSIVLETMYKKALDELLAVKANNPEKYPDFRKGDFISQAEHDTIMQNLKQIAPFIHTGSQSFLITKSKMLETKNVSYSRALNDTLETPPDMFVPANAGVAGIPFLTIGMGDGMMMQRLALDKAVQNTLKIFDGMHMPLDKITDYSEKANQSVYESYKGNPLREVLKSFAPFMQNASLIQQVLDESKEARLAVAKALGYSTKAAAELSAAELIAEMKTTQENLAWSADSVDARHEAMQQVAMSVDQMAAAASPAVNGSAELADTLPTPEQVQELLNEKYQALLDAKVATREAAPELPAEVKALGREHASGAQVMSWTAIKQLAKALKLTAAQQTIYEQIIRAMGSSQYKVVTGTREQLAAYQKAHGLTGLTQADSGRTHGYVSIGEKVIYLIDPSAETLVHELVHAASYETTLAHYQGLPVSPEVTEAVKNLETLMQVFLTAEPTEFQSLELKTAMEDARAAINNALMDLSTEPAVAKAQALNEFMAWSLTNAQLTEDLSKKQSVTLIQMAKNAVKAIKQLIWGKKLAPKVGSDFLSQLQFNTSVLVRNPVSLLSLAQRSTLRHQSGSSKSTRLENLRQALNTKIIQYLPQVAPVGVKGTATDVHEYLAFADLFAKKVAAIFPMTDAENSAFTSVVAALATQAKLDPNVLARAQEIYTHVAKTLTVEDFMPENSTNPDADRYYAAQKYDLLMGKLDRAVDKHGRTTMLSNFIGLAMVNDEFRNILAKMALPKTAKNEAKSLDALLENLGNSAMDKLHASLAGEKNNTNLQEAMDALAGKLYQDALGEEDAVSKVANQAQGYLDKGNDYLVNALTSLSDKGIALGDKLKQSGKGKLAYTTGNVIRAVASMASQDNADKMAESISSMMNQSNLSQSLRELVNDFIGRTESNANVYDMIKQVRSMVQQLRQQFREAVPKVIAGKFSRALSKEEWASLYRVMGKTDLASLLDGMPTQQALDLLANPKALEQYKQDLEELIRQADSKHWNRYAIKMKQLARYMTTGFPDQGLLRNATAIGNLYGQGVSKGWKPLSPDLIKAVDKLTTVYALGMLSQADREAVATLVQKENQGMHFTLNYLLGQRKGELQKITDGTVANNYFKGHLPSMQQPGLSLVVADDSKFLELSRLGYTRVGAYNGSAYDPKKDSRSYYFAPFSGKTAFSQGIMQNVKHTVSGVDETYGFSTGLTAGRITDPLQVKYLAKHVLENGNQDGENLMPVFDGKGDVVAFERSLHPAMLEKLNASQHLGEMIGVWRGRQVEEKLSRVVNEKLIQNLHDMWKKDTSKDSAHMAGEYVNLLDYRKLDPVHQDAVSLMSQATLDEVKAVFGENAFWVRKDMLNDVIGYRNASVGDFFTGTTRWSPETQKRVTNAMIGLFGMGTYTALVKNEQRIQGFFSDARTLIVVKSVVVPAANFVSNMYQLLSVGVPITAIAKGVPAKVAEIQAYTKSRVRQIELEAELRGVEGDALKERRIRAELRSITDSHSRMSIWPLIQAGEFSSVEDVGMTADDLELTSGNLSGWVEKQIDKLPAGAKTLAKYGYLTRDTALFQGLQKAVQYGDFTAKAVLFDHLTQRKGMTPAQALAQITEEFVNYDVLPGRGRSYLENMGLLWFYNYKLRITKIAARTLRNNPLHALLASHVPAPDGVGLPEFDNVVMKALEGTLGYSIGPGMAFQGLALNPWVNLVN